MKGTGQQLRWWIVEDALRDRQGHWLEYLRTFQRGLAAEGDQVRFFASKECVPEVADVFKAEPVLPKSIWARMSDGAPKWRRLLRIPAHGLATYRAISKLLADCPPPHAPGFSPTRRSGEPEGMLPAGRAMPDLIFVPTVLVHHLVGWVLLIKRKLRNLPCRVLLFFPNAPVIMSENGVARLLPDPTAKLFRICIRSLAKEVDAGKVILGAETRSMVKALSEVTGVPFTYLPHPVELSETKTPVTRHPVGRLGDPSPQTPVPATLDNPVVFGCYGAARYEKGSDVLQAAIRQVLETRPDVPAHFVFQWLEDFSDAAGVPCRLDPWLCEHPKVQVLENLFPEGGYERQLGGTDVMILPYRSAYRLRVSRVVIEAMNLGIPVIATRGTTLCEQAKEFGVVKACEEGSPDDLVRAIFSVMQNFKGSWAAAQAQIEASRSHFSVAEFRQRMLAANH
jgi:glycosyltransferase involved in cell wall biosynthesis